VNKETGGLKIGIHTGPLNRGAVYSGGIAYKIGVIL
jgi:hypothetical protein